MKVIVTFKMEVDFDESWIKNYPTEITHPYNHSFNLGDPLPTIRACIDYDTEQPDEPVEIIYNTVAELVSVEKAE